MATILEMAKNIHPTHTLSEEELHERYIEIYPSIKRDVEFFIHASPYKSPPLFISGQIGSGKTTFLKSLLLDKNLPVDYFDLSELEVEAPSNALEVSLIILKQILHLSNSIVDTTSIDTFISSARRKYDFIFNETDMKALSREYKCSKGSTVIIDGLDRLLELSSVSTIDQILFDYAFIWKMLEQKLIFVTPLHWVVYSAALDRYDKAYSPVVQSDYLHIILPSPDPEDRFFWDAFLDKRAKVDELRLTSWQRDKLLRLSGGVMRSMLINIHRLLNLMYRNGTSLVDDNYIFQLESEVLLSFQSFSQSLKFDSARRQALDEVKRNLPPLSDISLCLSSPPMVILTLKLDASGSQRWLWWRVHPLLNRYLPLPRIIG